MRHLASSVNENTIRIPKVTGCALSLINYGKKNDVSLLIIAQTNLLLAWWAKLSLKHTLQKKISHECKLQITKMAYSTMIKYEMRSVCLIYIKYVLWLIIDLSNRYILLWNKFHRERCIIGMYLLTKDNRYILFLNILRCLFRKPSFLRMQR